MMLMRPVILFVLFHCLCFYLSLIIDCFRVGRLNVHGARKAKKRALVFDATRMKHIDVLFLQEIHSDECNKADWDKDWEGQVALSHNTTTVNIRVGFLFSRSFAPFSRGGTCTEVEMSAYFQPEVCFSFELLQFRGDFLLLFFLNCTESILDRNHAEPHPASQHSLKQLVYSHGVVDVWRRTETECLHWEQTLHMVPPDRR